MPKIKHLPNTKQQGKYIGPHTVKRVTESHVVISKKESAAKEIKRYQSIPFVLTLNEKITHNIKSLENDRFKKIAKQPRRNL